MFFNLVEVEVLCVVVVAGVAATGVIVNTHYLVASRPRQSKAPAHGDSVARGPEPERLVGYLVVGEVNLHGQIGHEAEAAPLTRDHRGLRVWVCV